MNRVIKQIVSVLLLISATAAVEAKDMNQRFATFGLGAKSCAHYLGAVEAGDEMLDYYNNYTLGYLSAFNLIVPSTYDILGERSMSDAFDWLTDYCRKNPQSLYVNAVASLTESYFEKRQNFTPTGEGWRLPKEAVEGLRESLKRAPASE